VHERNGHGEQATSLRAARERLLADSSLAGSAFCRAYAAAADAWLRGLFEYATGGDHEGLALVAVGGYGREELWPHSDIDVVLVHDGRRRDVAQVAERLWYPVWDEGIRLDHSVKRPAEVLAVARADLRAQLGLIDSRLVAGSADVALPLLERALQLWRTHAPRVLPELLERTEIRHREHGEVAFLLEPDLKESHGGLRDLQVLRALVVAADELAGLVDLGSLGGAAEVLASARVALHRRSARATDRLLLQEQDEVARALGFATADALMAAVASAGRAVAWVSDDAWRRAMALARLARRGAGAGRARRILAAARAPWRRDEPPVAAQPTGSRTTASPSPPRGPRGPEGRQSLEERVVLRHVAPGLAEADLGPAASPRRDPALALELAAVAAWHDVPIARSALVTLAATCPPPPEPWPEPMRNALIEALLAGPPAIQALEALDHYGLLERLLPEWTAVRNRPQRNAYHRFTVDRHLLETAAQGALLAHRVARPDLLVLACLLHDIGKGAAGDHTEAGVRIVRTLTRRMGLDERDAQTIVTLVEHHLLLSELATRRDLDDPATVASLVAAVRDRQTLDLLTALTEADGIATGPAAWGLWKAGLVADLHARAAGRLEGAEPPMPLAKAVLEERHRGLIEEVRATRRPKVVVEPPRVVVLAPDRPGLLAAMTGVLALRGLDVRSADVAGEAGVAVEVFVVEPTRGRWPAAHALAEDLQAVLRGDLDLEARLAERARWYAPSRRSWSAAPPAPHVTIDNTASTQSTVVELRTEDEVGLLHKVTRALFECGLDVVAARVSTLGHEVVDAFYVRDRITGTKVHDHNRIRSIDRAVREAAS
jgi:[protein-PII] uridylyltransferase